MKNGTVLTHAQQLSLCAPITEAEIYLGLKGIEDDKALGVDGLYRAVNCTTITLVPKIPNPRFVPGRKIDDNIIMAHELVKTYSRKYISPRCMIKIDLKKAYDSVEWVYLRQILEELRFPEKFVTWIMECVQTVNYSIIINGELTPFDAAKGGDLKSVEAISQCFLLFSKASGLKANLDKSVVYFGGVESLERDMILRQLSYSSGEFHFKYLGIPLLSKKKLSILQWQPLIRKIVARVTVWTAKKLSYAGRVQLVHVVLFGTQSYWAQLFPLPSKVLKTIEAYCRSYVWTGANTISKKALIAWDKICAPKAAGGLNLINMDLWNKVAIAKNYWDLAYKEDKLWI
ncbi:hypothetical protein KY284_000609 [Solanum tuberosum]|nr:hypothetical protein KY284_000609 [Solanum tuberosum]